MYEYLYRDDAFTLTISTIYPNYQDLRPTKFTQDNIFVTITQFLYSIDTSTNLFPSIHVFNVLGVHIAIVKGERYSNKKYNYIKLISFIVMVSIILATVFLKQHSCFDVATAFLMQAVLYPFIYGKHNEDLERKLKAA